RFNLLLDYVSGSDMIFRSVNPSIAEIENEKTGVVTGMRPGVTQIVVSKDDMRSVFTVYVTEKQGAAIPMVVAGNSHTLALKSDGTVWAWGSNARGQLGLGNNLDTSIPVCLEALRDQQVISISAGEYHSLALTKNGEIYSWGDNALGQLGLDLISSGEGGVTQPTLVTGLPKVSKISAGLDHTAALTQNGLVYTWGSNQYGKLGNGSTVTFSRKPVQVKNINKVVDISTGEGANVIHAIRYDGTIWGWGNNGFNQIEDSKVQTFNTPQKMKLQNGDETYDDRVVKICNGSTHTAALLNDGRIISWGLNNKNQLGNGSERNETKPYATPKEVVGIDGTSGSYAIDLAVGVTHNLALMSDQTVRVWGDGDLGRLGMGQKAGSTEEAVPVTLLNGDQDHIEAIGLAAGGGHSLVICSDGLLASFGNNSNGQVGNGKSGASGEFGNNPARANRWTPGSVTAHDPKIVPESIVLPVTGTVTPKAEFGNFYVTEEPAELISSYLWEIVEERDESGNEVTKGSIASFSDPENHVILANNLGTARLEVTDPLLGLTISADIETVRPGSIRPKQIFANQALASINGTKYAAEQAILDTDEYLYDSDTNTVKLVEGLTGVYSVRTKLVNGKATLKIESIVNTDTIKLYDKAGNELANGVQEGDVVTFADLPSENGAADYYLTFFNPGISDVGEGEENFAFDGKYKLRVSALSNDTSLNKLRIGKTPNHTDLQNGVGDIITPVKIEGTNQYYVIIDDTDAAMDLYIYGEAQLPAEISINNQAVNADHTLASAQQPHGKYFDVQKVTILGHERLKSVPVGVKATDGVITSDGSVITEAASSGYVLAIYKRSMATEISDIEVSSRNKADDFAEAVSYNVYRRGDFDFDVVVPKGIASVDIKTAGQIPVAKAQYLAQSPNGDQSYTDTPAVYEDFILSNIQTSDTVQIRLKVDDIEGLPYRLNIIQLSDSNDPMVNVNYGPMLNRTSESEGIYISAISSDDETAVVSVTTIREGTNVKIGDFEEEVGHSEQTVEVSFNEDGYCDVPFYLVGDGEVADDSNRQIVRIYRQEADTRLSGVVVRDRATGEEYQGQYSIAHGGYLVKVKDGVTDAEITATTYQSAATVKLTTTQDEAQLAIGTSSSHVLSPVNLPVNLENFELFATVRPEVHSVDSDHYPKQIFRIALERMSDNTDVNVTIAGKSFDLDDTKETYDYTLPRSDNGQDNTRQVMTVQAADQTARITISRNYDYTMDYRAENKAKADVVAANPNPDVVFIHVLAEDGTRKRYQINVGKLDDDTSIAPDGVQVMVQDKANVATYDAATNTFTVKSVYSVDNVLVTVQPSNQMAYVRIGEDRNYVAPTQSTIEEPWTAKISDFVMTPITFENAKTSTKIYVQRPDGIDPPKEYNFEIIYTSANNEIASVSETTKYPDRVMHMDRDIYGYDFHLSVKRDDVERLNGYNGVVTIKAVASDRLSTVTIFDGLDKNGDVTSIEHFVDENLGETERFIGTKAVTLKNPIENQPLVQIKVSPEDGSAPRIYLLKIEIESEDNGIDPNGFVKAADIGDEDPALVFDSVSRRYSVEVVDSATSLPIRVRANHFAAKVAIDSFNPATQVGPQNITYSTTNDVIQQVYSLAGADLINGINVPIYVKAENGDIATYTLFVQRDRGDVSLHSIEAVYAGGKSAALADDADPTHYIIGIPESLDTLDLIVTPNSRLTRKITIAGDEGSVEETTGVHTWFNYNVADDENLTVVISVESANGEQQCDYTLTIQRLRVNTNIRKVTANPGSATENT
ncbi:MAG: hypothetical protein DBX49_05395, partial [Clostridia bacterium]